MRPPLPLLLLLLLPAALAAGCTKYRDPVLSVTGVRLLEETDEGIGVGFTVQMENPNAEELELLNFVYDLGIDGRTVYHGRRAAQLTLGGKTSRYVMLPAVIPYARAKWEPGAIPDEFTYRLGGKLGYVTPGELAETLLDLGLRRPKVSFAATGRVTGGRREGLPETFQNRAPDPDGPAQ